MTPEVQLENPSAEWWLIDAKRAWYGTDDAEASEDWCCIAESCAASVAQERGS